MVDTNISIRLLWPNGNFDAANATFVEFMNNNTDVYFSTSLITVLPSFYDSYMALFESANPTGFNGLIGSRLIPETVVHNQPNDVA